MTWTVKEINSTNTESKAIEQYARKMNDIVNPYYKEGTMGFMTLGCYKRALEESGQHVAFLWPKTCKNKNAETCVGFAWAIDRKRPGSIKCVDPPFVQVKQIVVENTHRGKKGGSALMNWLKNSKTDCNIALQLMPNNTRAIGFYQKHGFIQKELIKTGAKKDRTEAVMSLHKS